MSLSLQLFLYEALGLCPEGHGGQLIDSSKWIKNKNGTYDYNNMGLYFMYV